MTKLNVTFDQLIDERPIVQQPSDPPADPNGVILTDPPADPPADPADPGNPGADPTDPQDPQDPKDPQNPDGSGGEPGEETALRVFREALGYEVEGEFEESIDGLIEYTRKAIPVAAQQVIEEVFEEYPEAEILIKHLREGNSLDTFVEQFRQPELVKQEITEQTDPLILERIIRENLASKGLDKDEVDLHINYAKDTNTLFSKSKKSFDEIKARHEQSVNAKKQSEQDELKRIQDKQIETWNNVNKLVNSGKIGSTVVPDAEKAKFLEFISKPVKENKTMREMKYEEMTLEDHLYLDYLVYKDAMKRVETASKKRDSLFDELMAKRNPNRMTSTSTQSQKNVQTKTAIRDPKESLRGLSFENLIE